MRSPVGAIRLILPFLQPKRSMTRSGKTRAAEGRHRASEYRGAEPTRFRTTIFHGGPKPSGRRKANRMDKRNNTGFALNANSIGTSLKRLAEFWDRAAVDVRPGAVMPFKSQAQ